MDEQDTGRVVACSLNDEEFKARRALARDTLLRKVVASNRTADGLTISFQEGDALRDNLEQFIALERQCCGFLDFSVSEPPSNELVISGPPEAASTIDIFAAATKRGD